MKKWFLCLFACCTGLIPEAQLVPKSACGLFNVDLLSGTVSGVRPDLHPDKIKEKLPCFTLEEREGAESRCGGTLHYKDRDIYFFTNRDYVEIGPGFKGKLSLPLMGAKRNGIYKWLGHPKLKDPDWEAYQTQYGCLVLYFTKSGVVNKIQFSTRPTERLQLCK